MKSKLFSINASTAYKLSCMEMLTQLNATTYRQLPTRELLPEQVKEILVLYAISKQTKQIDLLNLEKQLFIFYTLPDFTSIARQFHLTHWEYIKGQNRELLILK